MNNRLIIITAFVAVLGFNLHIRAFPAYFPQLKTTAVESVSDRAYSEVALSVEKRFPGIPRSAGARLVTAEFEKYRKANSALLSSKVEEEYLKLKDRFQDKRGQTYLMELDCWNWMRYVDNILLRGHPGDALVGGKPYDMLMNAPEGAPIPWSTFLFYLSAWSYRIVNFIFPMALESFLFYLPLFFMTLLIAALFFFCARYFGMVCAMVSCLFIGLAPILIHRSAGGWFDTDVLNLLFPLLAAVCYLISSEAAGWKRYGWIVFSSFWIGLFASTWLYWFVFAFIIVAYEGYTILNLYSERLQYKTPTGPQVAERFRSLAVFALGSFVFVIMFSGLAPFREMYSQIAQALNLNDVLVSVWPNVFSTVSELKRPDFMSIGNSTGNTFLFCMGLIAMLFLLFSSKKFSGVRREAIFMFTIWFMVMFLVCFKGTRFIIFLLIPMGILLGWGAEAAFALAAERSWKVGRYMLAGFVVYAAFSCMNAGYKAATGIFPLMNDRWYAILSTIRTETPPGSVVNSWWDYGDWFKTAAGRPVIFDGQSQVTPRAFWMARALLTDNEKEAVGILRMLNNGGNKAFDLIDKRLKDPFRSLLLLRELIVADRAEASERLRKLLPADEALKVEELLFKTPGKAYFVVDDSMLMKIPSISFIGNWDAAKVFVAENAGRKSTEEINAYLSKTGMERQAGEKLLSEAALISRNDMSSWISRNLYFHGSFPSGLADDGLVFFNNGSVYKAAERKFYFFDLQSREYRLPRSLVTVDGDVMEETQYPSSGMNTSAVVFRMKDSYQLMLMTREIAQSLFFRLHFLHGNGLSHFRLFSQEKDVATVYEILW